jgi:hypothetical protein
MNAMRVAGDLAWSTLRLWWRCLVPLLVCLLAGYLAFEALFSASWRLGARDERLGLPVLAVAQLCELAAWVAMFLVVGRRLSLSTDRPFLDTVLLTLTPFLAFYALWGHLEPLIADHTWLAVSYEDRGDAPTQVGAAGWKLYLPIAAAAWVLKTVLARVTRLTVVLEAVWLFLAFWALTEAAQAAAGWVQDRVAWQWAATALGWFDWFTLPLPQILPGVKDVLVLPLVWLAIAALVYRGKVAGDTVERGIARLRWDRRILVNLFTRDYRDKYLPMLASIRMTLRLGIGFLAALCLLYAATIALADWAYVGAVALLDDAVEYPGFLEGTLDLGHQVLVQPLQVCLLAVAYDTVSRTREPAAARS